MRESVIGSAFLLIFPEWERVAMSDEQLQNGMKNWSAVVA